MSSNSSFSFMISLSCHLLGMNKTMIYIYKAEMDRNICFELALFGRLLGISKFAGGKIEIL